MTRAKITIYQKPTCTMCRQVYLALKNRGVDFDAVDYYLDPIPKTKLIELLDKMGIKPRELLRTKEPIYRDLKIGQRQLSDDQVVDLMVSIQISSSGRLSRRARARFWQDRPTK